jgi:hypothetical protein
VGVKYPADYIVLFPPPPNPLPPGEGEFKGRVYESYWRDMIRRFSSPPHKPCYNALWPSGAGEDRVRRGGPAGRTDGHLGGPGVIIELQAGDGQGQGVAQEGHLGGELAAIEAAVQVQEGPTRRGPR